MPEPELEPAADLVRSYGLWGVPPTVLPKAFRYEALAAPRIVSVAPERVATKGGTEITVAHADAQTKP